MADLNSGLSDPKTHTSDHILWPHPAAQRPYGHLLIPTCLHLGLSQGRHCCILGHICGRGTVLTSRQLAGWGMGTVPGEVFLDCRGSTKPQSRLPACWPLRLAQPCGHACGHWSLVTAPALRGACLVACGYWEGSLGCKGLSLPSH